jgi:hypothetical protein
MFLLRLCQTCAVTFQVLGLFCITRLTLRGSNFNLIPEK